MNNEPLEISSTKCQCVTSTKTAWDAFWIILLTKLSTSAVEANGSSQLLLCLVTAALSQLGFIKTFSVKVKKVHMVHEIEALSSMWDSLSYILPARQSNWEIITISAIIIII